MQITIPEQVIEVQPSDGELESADDHTREIIRQELTRRLAGITWAQGDSDAVRCVNQILSGLTGTAPIEVGGGE